MTKQTKNKNSLLRKRELITLIFIFFSYSLLPTVITFDLLLLAY